MVRLIVLVVLIAWSGLAIAEKQAFACQFTRIAGLQWENGRWNVAEFRTRLPFALVMEGGTLTLDSAAVALNIPNFPEVVACQTARHGRISCGHEMGSGLLIFDPVTARGGVAEVHGSTLEYDWRDPLEVAAFTCQKI